jgi:hypothetical protein
MRRHVSQIERSSLATLAAILISIVPSSAWAMSATAKGEENPTASTNPTTTVGPTSASVTGTVNPNGRSTSFHFAWMKVGSSSWSSTPSTSAGSGSSDRSVSADLAGLSPSTTYHFWIVATNSKGTTLSGDRVLTTLPPPPLVATGAATAVGQTSATLSSDVNPNGAPATYHFDVGVTPEYGSHWPASDAPAGSDNLLHTVTQSLTALLPGTTYHYRAVATTASGTTNGVDRQFTTTGVPAAVVPGAPGTPGALGTPGLAISLPPATPPVLGQSATIAAVSGTVLVQLPGAASSLSLDDTSTVPVGTSIDATAGTVKLTNVQDATGKLQTATFWGGSFTVRQTRGKSASTVLSLTAPMTCPKSARHLSALTADKPRIRQLWGKDNNGRFVTRGRSAVATVRGTLWLLRDTCAGTLVKVARGEVAVRDLVKKRTIIIEAGHSYLARTK